MIVSRNVGSGVEPGSPEKAASALNTESSLQPLSSSVIFFPMIIKSINYSDLFFYNIVKAKISVQEINLTHHKEAYGAHGPYHRYYFILNTFGERLSGGTSSLLCYPRRPCASSPDQ